MKKKTKLLTLILAGTLTLMLTACGSNNTAQTENSSEVTAQNKEEETVVNIPADETPTADTAPSQEPVVVTIGTTSDDPRLWDALQAELDARGDNIKIEFKNIDGTILNQAVADGELDLNSFQHYAYFEANTADLGLDLTAIGETLIVPLNLFSTKHASLDELPDGAQIAIPEDATNQGRALHVLEKAGLITLADGVGVNGTVSDIAENPKNIRIVEMSGPELPRTLEDVDAAIINCGYATDFGLDPINDPIFKDDIDFSDPAQHPFVNIIAARTEDKDNPIYLEVVSAYHSEGVYNAILEVYHNAAIPAFEY